MKKKNDTFFCKMITIMCTTVLLISLSGCQYIEQLRDDTLPIWIEDLVWEDPELLWAYQNGYFFEDPITDEIGDTRFVIWTVLSDNVLTQLLLSAEAIEGDECMMYGSITALDGVPIEYASKGEGYLDYGRVVGGVPYIFTPSPGEHKLMVQFKDAESGSIVLEKEVEFNNSELAALNTTYQIDRTIETDNGESLKIDKVIYTPSMIYVSIKPNGVERIYGHIGDKDIYIQADNKKLQGEPRQSENYGGYIPYYMAYPHPKKAKDVELVIPFLVYTEEANLSFSKSDIGKTKSIKGTDLTLQDWRVKDESLELDILHSSTGNLYKITEWTLPESGIKSVNVSPLDWSDPVGDDKLLTYIFDTRWDSEDWLTTDTVTISLVKVLQEGPWTMELPAIEEYEDE